MNQQNEYPISDDQYTEHKLENVKRDAGPLTDNSQGGWTLYFDGGWTYYITESPIFPAIGMTLRLYGKGIGYRVRGLFLDGVKVFYQTAEEDQEFCDNQQYGKDAEEWLQRWDVGDSVWSVDMGGLGPGYEQAIQIAAVEMVRFLVTNSPTRPDSDSQMWRELMSALENQDNAVIDALHTSGAQFYAARNLAANIYRRGPKVVKEVNKERQILISRDFPRAPE